jgi:hypothetical protein
MSVVAVKPGTEAETLGQKAIGVLEADRERIELDGRKAFFKLRSSWSKWIIAWISALIAFNIVLTLSVGTRLLDFRDYEWFVTAVTVETFLQIVGMGYIAVRYLFSD